MYQDSEEREVEFVRDKIKGKIAEIIFQHMMSKTNVATVIPLGYENLTPTVAQFQQELDKDANLLLKRIRSLPDFLLISKDNRRAVLVEVRYRKNRLSKTPVDLAKEIGKEWKECFLFLAMQEGFFFGECQAIVKNGDIEPLSTRLVRKVMQDTFLALLCAFTKNLT